MLGEEQQLEMAKAMRKCRLEHMARMAAESGIQARVMAPDGQVTISPPGVLADAETSIAKLFSALVDSAAVRVIKSLLNGKLRKSLEKSLAKAESIEVSCII